MSDNRPPTEPERAAFAPHGDDGSARGASGGPEPRPAVEPVRLPPLLPRRQRPWLLVEVDGSPAGHGALVWSLREAARRDGTVVAVWVVDTAVTDSLGTGSRAALLAQLALHDRLEAQVLRAIAETGVHGRSQSAILARPVFDALTASSRGADLVVVGPGSKTVLRPAVRPSPDPPPRPGRMSAGRSDSRPARPLGDRFRFPAAPPTVGPCPRPTLRDPSPATPATRRCSPPRGSRRR